MNDTLWVVFVSGSTPEQLRIKKYEFMKLQLGNITAIHGDCMDYMRSLPDKCFDLAIVDPPYGIGIDGQKKSINKNPKYNRKEHVHKGWDNSIPEIDYFKELFRVSENQIIWGGNYMVEFLNPKKGWIVWDKGQYNLTMSDCELAYSSFDCKTRVYKINRVELLKQKTIHPTEKPIELYRWLLSNYAKVGDKILDTHGGSFSHAIACHDLGFYLTIIEKDKDYFDAAIKRLKWHQRQQILQFT